MMSHAAPTLLHRLLAHPLTRGLDLDDPRTTALRRQIIQSKPCLRRIYTQWYRLLGDALPASAQPALELGSGAGFLREVVPQVLTSEVFPGLAVDLIADAQQLPLPRASLRGIVMTNVLHHIPDPRKFFAEAARCVSVGGAVAMVEPWVNCWAQWVYTHLHHEPFDPQATDWRIAGSGPLSDANGALPWIMFARDRQQFEREFPQWRVETVRPLMPLRYLLSGGVSLRNLCPLGLDYLVRGVEALLPGWGMFAYIVLRRVASDPGGENGNA